MKLNYTVAEFRKDMRMVFNAVDMGASVTVERYGKKYLLTKLSEPDAFLISPKLVKGNPALAAEVDQKLSKVAGAEPTLCPHGYAKGMCKKDTCNKKYAP